MAMEAERNRQLSVVVPVYNEVENLDALHQAVVQALEPLGGAFELILVNDGSQDGSKQVLDRLAQQDPRVKVVHFVRNYGQTAAMSAGFRLASFPLVITLDADLQNDPRDIPAMLTRLEEGFDVVCGWRRDRQDDFLTRTLPSRIANRIISAASRVHLHDYGCTLRVYRREYLSELPLYGEMHRFIPIYVTWAGARLAEMPVTHHPRTRGQSKYGLSRTFKVLLDLLTVKFLRDYYVNPIYFFGIFGFFLGFCGVGSFSAAIFMKLQFGTWMHKNPFVLFGVMFFIMSLVMFMMGLLAEILIRMHFELQGKAPYRVREVKNLTGEGLSMLTPLEPRAVVQDASPERS